MNKNLVTSITLILLCNGVFGQELFREDFETDLRQWESRESGIAQILRTGDAAHKSVLKLTPNRTAGCVLIKDSDQWDKVVVKGQFLFPSEQHDYFGFVYNYHGGDRTDFGCIYVKGKGSYIRVNPHRDGNASRALYEEYKTELTGNEEIHVNQWIPFKAEVIGSECHFYVADMDKPKVIFRYFEFAQGKLGFKPRLVGGDVWLDDICVAALETFSYVQTDTSPTIEYHKDQMLNAWTALGPFNQRIAEIEQSAESVPMILNGKEYRWTEQSTDGRGCLLAGRVCRYATDEKFAYFSTRIHTDTDFQTEIQFSSLNNLHVWVNSQYLGAIEKQTYAWFDFYLNPEHAGKSLPLSLEKGDNRILVLVEGANYSGDGFYSFIAK